ncbi:hypothetical protein Tco_0905072 [Tanacetum coccineum]
MAEHLPTKLRASPLPITDEGWDAAFETLPADMEVGEKTVLMKKAYRTLIICLGDSVLREVTKEKTITEASLRRHLKLEDFEGLTSLPNKEIFEQLTNMGYAITSDSLTFLKGHFSPQWKFFIHTILHCLSSKKTAWDQFSSNLATAIICLATNRTCNFSRYIFDVMVKNLDSTHKFLMYPRFIQIFLNKHQNLLFPHTRIYPTPTLTNKLFNNMRRATKGYSGVITPLFDTMLVQPQGEAPSTSPSRISSSPSLQSHHTTSSTPTTPPSTQHPHEAEEPTTMPHDSPLEVMRQTKTTYSTSLTKLVLRVKKLENQLKSGKARRRARIVLSEGEDFVEDLPLHGRKIPQIDTDPNISLVQDEGTSLFQQDKEVHEKTSADTEVLVQEETLTEIVEDIGSGEKG